MNYAVKSLLLSILVIPFSILRADESLVKDFEKYLSKIRNACLERDTSELHDLFGDAMFGNPCTENQFSKKSAWSSFNESFELDERIEKSKFWEIFLTLSAQGYYIDEARKGNFRIPKSNTWGGSYSLNTPRFDKNGYRFINENVKFYESPKDGANFTIKKVFNLLNPKVKYPYKIVKSENDFFEILVDDFSFGFVKWNEVIYWNLQFNFIQKDGKWKLIYYDGCNFY